MARVWMGLAVAFAGTWVMAYYVQRSAAHTTPSAIASSVALAMAAVVLAVATAFQMGLIPMEATGRSSFASARRLALPALWIAPTILLGREGSMMALAAGLILFVSAARLGVDVDEIVDARFWRSLAVAGALQAVVVLIATGMTTLAVLVFGVCVATLVYMVRRARVERRWRGVLSAALACLVTVLLLLPKVPPVGNGDQSVAEAKAGTDAKPAGNDGGTAEPGDWHTGIILWPKVKKNVTMIAPAALYPRESLLKTVDVPLEIPFTGVYWLFQPPYVKPPDKSPVERGTPADFHFRSNDLSDMTTEARQNLGVSVPLRRLTGIQVVVNNEEPFPNSILAELLVLNSRSPVPPVSLGRVVVATGAGALHYRVPMGATMIDSFDGLIVRMTRVRTQGHIGARVAVEKFVFMR